MRRLCHPAHHHLHILIAEDILAIHLQLSTYGQIDHSIAGQIKVFALLVVTTQLKALFDFVHFSGILFIVGIPEEFFIESLIAFNLGIEAGQIFVIAVAYIVPDRKM